MRSIKSTRSNLLGTKYERQPYRLPFDSIVKRGLITLVNLSVDHQEIRHPRFLRLLIIPGRRILPRRVSLSRIDRRRIFRRLLWVILLRGNGEREARYHEKHEQKFLEYLHPCYFLSFSSNACGEEGKCVTRLLGNPDAIERGMTPPSRN